MAAERGSRLFPLAALALIGASDPRPDGPDVTAARASIREVQVEAAD